jgi:hypothetical protein
MFTPLAKRFSTTCGTEKYFLNALAENVYLSDPSVKGCSWVSETVVERAEWDRRRKRDAGADKKKGGHR